MLGAPGRAAGPACRCGELLDQAAGTALTAPPETSATERRRLWQPAGVRTDEISGTMITWGLRPPDGNRWSAMKRDGPRASLWACYASSMGESFHRRSPRSTGRWPIQPGIAI
ncbi:MAG: TIGR02679 domain-containing protein [Streptosporangiaceae bacterium]